MMEKYFGVFKGITKKWGGLNQFEFTLPIPLGNIFLSPKKLVQYLELKENHNVLEVGAGSGYFSTKVAQAIPSGRLMLADIQEEMLELAKKRLSKKRISNVEYHLCNEVDFPFEKYEFDRIYMVTALGEIENKNQYIKEFFRILSPSGIISISEQGGNPDKMSIDEIKVLFKDSGFKFYRFHGNKRNFTITFRK